MKDIDLFIEDLFGEKNVVKTKDIQILRKESRLKQLQALALHEKIDYAKDRIKEFVEKVGGPDHVFVSFSGGKDSTVLLHLVRSLYPDVRAVFFISNDEEYMTAMKERQKEIKSWYKRVKQDISEKGEDSDYYKYHKYFN